MGTKYQVDNCGNVKTNSLISCTAICMCPTTAPAASAGKMYFDSATCKLKVSNDGSTYSDMAPPSAPFDMSVGNEIQSAMQITCLSCKAGVPDVVRMNMVNDMFSTAIGYNSTACTGSTTSTYDAINKFYQNTSTITCTNAVLCYAYSSNCGNGTWNYCHDTSNMNTFGAGSAISGSLCWPTPITFGNINCFYKFSLIMCHSVSCSPDGATQNSFTCLSIPLLNIGVSCTAAFSKLTCIDYVKAGECIFNIFCNGVCLCQVSGNCSITMCTVQNAGRASANANLYKYGYCISNTGTCICCKLFCAPVKSVYLSTQGPIGVNSCIRYDVCSGVTLLCSNLSPNTNYNMTTCCCMLNFNIKQCSPCVDGTGLSCINAYGIAVGF